VRVSIGVRHVRQCTNFDLQAKPDAERKQQLAQQEQQVSARRRSSRARYQLFASHVRAAMPWREARTRFRGAFRSVA
jgi:hypothetical protein